MLRFNILASVVPLVVAAVFARGELLSGPQPCIAVGDASVQIAALPWQAELHVSFTERSQARDRAGADFRQRRSRRLHRHRRRRRYRSRRLPEPSPPQLVAISASPSASDPVIYLSADGPADYRIFVHSKTFSARDAAALIVGARGGQHRLAAASL